MANKHAHQPTALITGAAKRIGQAIALHLAKQGYNIALHYHHSQKDAERIAAEINRQGGGCETFHCNLFDTQQTKQLISRVTKTFPTLEVLINNASIFEKSNLRSAGLEAFDRNIAIHLKAPYILTMEFARRCQTGHIINILDTNVVKNKVSHLAYLLSKKALYDLTLLAAVDLAPKIRVNAVAPGLILPPAKAKPEYMDLRAQGIPLKKKGNPEQVASAIQFLLENDYLTGQVIFADGGEHLLS